MFLMNALPTDQPTNRPTDTAYLRDARTHLKMTFFKKKCSLPLKIKEIGDNECVTVPDGRCLRLKASNLGLDFFVDGWAEAYNPLHISTKTALSRTD